MTSSELIPYIKKRDRYYQGYDMSDYSHNELVDIKRYIDNEMEGLPDGYSIDSNGKAEQRWFAKPKTDK